MSDLEKALPGATALAKLAREVERKDDDHMYGVNPYPRWFEKSTIKAGSRGKWDIEPFTVPRDAQTMLMNLRYMRDGEAEMVVPPGRYTRLCDSTSRRNPLMSDTPGEAWHNARFTANAMGRCLVTGLGMGWIIENAFRKVGKFEHVSEITVIEQDADLIELVSPHFSKEIAEGRLKIIHADAFEWKLPQAAFWDVVYHDIWWHLGSDIWPEISKIKRKFSRRCMWQGHWGEVHVKRQKNEARRASR